MGAERAGFEIAGRGIGPGQPVYVVAEVSANHRQDFGEALRILEAAKDAGVDAVKLQTYTPDTMTLDCEDEVFLVEGTPWAGRRLYELYGEAYTPWEWHPKLQEAASRLGLGFFSTPFDESSVEFLESLNVPAYKIASFELTDLPLLRRVAGTGKPVLLSTGMATFAEIEEAVETLRGGGASGLALLQCVSAYPAPADEMNLRTIPELSRAFSAPAGLSDHSLDLAVPVAAVAVGACIVEKHLTLSRSAGGPDSSFSLEPREFRELVRAVRTAEAALGEARFGPAARELPSLGFRRSLFATRDIAAGEVFTAENVRVLRPAAGLAPRHREDVLGRRAKSFVARGTPLRWDLVE